MVRNPYQIFQGQVDVRIGDFKCSESGAVKSDFIASINGQ